MTPPARVAAGRSTRPGASARGGRPVRCTTGARTISVVSSFMALPSQLPGWSATDANTGALIPVEGHTWALSERDVGRRPEPPAAGALRGRDTPRACPHKYTTLYIHLRTCI